MNPVTFTFQPLTRCFTLHSITVCWEKMASMKLWKDVGTEVFNLFFLVFQLVFLGVFFFSTLSIRVSVFHQSTYLLQVVLELIPGGWGVYTLSRPPVCCRVNTERRITSHSHIHTPAANLQSPVNLMSLSLSCVRNLECLEKVHCVDQSHSGDKCRLVQLYLGEGDISAAERLPLTGWFA